MEKKTLDKTAPKKKRLNMLIIAALILISLAIVLFIWTYIAQIDAIKMHYAELQTKLTQAQNFIASLENKWLLILIIFLLYALKGFVIFIPLSTLFIVSGMVFDVQYATAINIVGVTILVSIKFFWGSKFGGGGALKLITHFKILKELMRLEHSGNPFILFIARFVPIVPVNTVSRLYGASEIDYDKYLLISLLGFAPRILSFSVLGNHVFDPFSVGFFAPIIIMLFLSGFSMLILNFTLGFFRKEKGVLH
ncbi:MAG TPA: VTT domain-containing protein [Oscillospiraceae bacterium]|nr:VTT domain-containing protein [Oscillospiraceae bacterium]